MKSILDSAHTWFLESFAQGAYEPLVIRVVEGSLSGRSASFEVVGKTFGPYESVETTSESRRVEIRFDPVFAFFTHREDVDTVDPARVFENPNSFIREVTASSLKAYADIATGMVGRHWGPVHEYHVWTADQIFQLFSTQPPVVEGHA